MKKQYMDFVPVKAKKTAKKAASTTRVSTVRAKTTRVLATRTVGTAKDDEIKEIKAKKIGNRRGRNLVEKPVEKADNSRVRVVDLNKKTFEVPKATFINQEKVIKRPLSKNVYQKKVEEFKENQKGPVTIISKPEKDSKTGLIVTIILTIILGAAAGTVAFLLLPK